MLILPHIAEQTAPNEPDTERLSPDEHTDDITDELTAEPGVNTDEDGREDETDGPAEGTEDPAESTDAQQDGETDTETDKQPDKDGEAEVIPPPPTDPTEPTEPVTPPTPPTPPEVTDTATVKSFLSSALTPIGSTLYVYGGGWNEADTAAGYETMTVGLSPRWKEFFDENNSAYDYSKTSYQIHNGLDCTGYVGYAAWQVFGDKYSKDGYVFASGKVGDSFTRIFGGSVTPRSQLPRRRAGDIMVKNGHVFIVMGECSDGSVLLAHASPPNVTLSGTCTPNGNKYSEALSLAEKYMKKIAPTAFERYPQNCSRGITYLTDYDLYRFPDTVLSDPDGLCSLSVDDLMAELTKDIK